MKEIFRTEFLKDWVKNSSVDDIVQKLIELDNFKKEKELTTNDKTELENLLNMLENITFDECVNSSLHSNYKDVLFYKGFEACICVLKDCYNIKNNIDIYNTMRYL